MTPVLLTPFFICLSHRSVYMTPMSENDDTGKYTFLCHNERKGEHYSESIFNFRAVRHAKLCGIVMSFSKISFLSIKDLINLKIVYLRH